MNKQEINKEFFEDLHKSQMDSINNSIIEDARKVILSLLLFLQPYDRDDIPGKNEAISEALEWIKNHAE